MFQGFYDSLSVGRGCNDGGSSVFDPSPFLFTRCFLSCSLLSPLIDGFSLLFSSFLARQFVLLSPYSQSSRIRPLFDLITWEPMDSPSISAIHRHLYSPMLFSPPPHPLSRNIAFFPFLALSSPSANFFSFSPFVSSLSLASHLSLVPPVCSPLTAFL